MSSDEEEELYQEVEAMHDAQEWAIETIKAAQLAKGEA